MRLPAVTEKQRQNEDAREVHERLYASFRAHGPRVLLPVTEAEIATKRAWNMQENFHQFWSRRGFTLRTKLRADRTALEMWLEPRRVTAPAPRVERAPVDLAWRQPAVR